MATQTDKQEAAVARETARMSAVLYSVAESVIEVRKEREMWREKDCWGGGV